MEFQILKNIQLQCKKYLEISTQKLRIPLVKIFDFFRDFTQTYLGKLLLVVKN